MTTIIGHHGTTLKVAEQLVKRTTNLQARTNKYDWLGTGVYFWQDGPTRALAWARYTAARAVGEEPAVVEAEIDLDGCLDLFDLEAFRELQKSYTKFESFEASNPARSVQAGLIVMDGRQSTTSHSGAAGTPDPVRNFRDCAFLDWHIAAMRSVGHEYRSVRGAFLSGRALFTESFLFDWSHAQIAVLDLAVIKRLDVHPLRT